MVILEKVLSRCVALPTGPTPFGRPWAPLGAVCVARLMRNGGQSITSEVSGPRALRLALLAARWPIVCGNEGQLRHAESFLFASYFRGSSVYSPARWVVGTQWHGVATGRGRKGARADPSTLPGTYPPIALRSVSDGDSPKRCT
jgi:hypothetical protein